MFSSFIPGIFFTLLANMLSSSLTYDFGNTSGSMNNMPENLLQPTDLPKLLKSLSNVVQYFWRNYNDIDFTMHIGLFMQEVNLNMTLSQNYRKLPKSVMKDIETLLQKNSELLRFSTKNYERINYNPDNEHFKNIASLFIDISTWLAGVRPFQIYPSKNLYYQNDYDIEKNDYDKYLKLVYDYEHLRPTPTQSDACLKDISANPLGYQNTFVKCNINNNCTGLLLNGSSYGYAITHRLLWILAARLGRGCHMLSIAEDAALSKEFCATIYNEAEFIAANGFTLNDLLFEQIALCSLDGHGLFFRRSWIYSLLEFQSVYGCFNIVPEINKTSTTNDFKMNEHWRVLKNDFQMLGGACNVHATAVATAAISAGVRFIIEVS